MSHKQCYEKRELLNRENLAQATEIGKLRAENSALQQRVKELGDFIETLKGRIRNLEGRC